MWLWTLAIHLVLVHATFSKSEINQVRKAGENAFAKHDLKMVYLLNFKYNIKLE